MRIHLLSAVAVLLTALGSGCSSVDSTGVAPSANRATASAQSGAHQVTIPGGAVTWNQSPPKELTIKYDDGQQLSVYGVSRGHAYDVSSAGSVRVAPDDYQQFSDVACLDGRPALDTELWLLHKPVVNHVGPAFLGASRTTHESIYQGCKDGKIYTAASLAPLMRVLTGEAPQSVSSNEVTVTDLSETRLPVCDWRRRTGLDAVLPAPEYVAHTTMVPAYDGHLGHLDVTRAAGTTHIFFNSARRLKKIEADTKQHSIVIQTPEEDADCDRLDKCARAEIIIDRKKVAVESLDERPVFQSRLYQSAETSGAKRYYACQSGKLFITKSRASAESELKIAAQNPAVPTEHKAPWIDFKDSMTTESGAVVIPDQFCDWDYRAAQIKKIAAGAQSRR